MRATLGRWLALRAAPQIWRELGPTVLWPISTWSKLAYLSALRDYLVDNQPEAMLAAMTPCNLVAIWVRQLAGVATRLVVSERNMLSGFAHAHAHQRRWRRAAALVGATYPRTDTIVGVSRAVADDLAATAGLGRQRITTVVNPVVDATLRRARPAGCASARKLSRPMHRPMVISNCCSPRALIERWLYFALKSRQTWRIASTGLVGFQRARTVLARK